MARAKHGDDDNTEKELIALLEKVLGDFFKEDRRLFANIAARLAVLEENSTIRHQQIMTARETLPASVPASQAGQSDLTTAVQEALTHIGSPNPTDAQLLTLASVIDSNTARVSTRV